MISRRRRPTPSIGKCFVASQLSFTVTELYASEKLVPRMRYVGYRPDTLVHCVLNLIGQFNGEAYVYRAWNSFDRSFDLVLRAPSLNSLRSGVRIC